MRPRNTNTDAGPAIPPRLLRFMNSMPVDLDITACVQSLQLALQELLEDVDRLAVFVNTSCDLDYDVPDNAPSDIRPEAPKALLIAAGSPRERPDDLITSVTTVHLQDLSLAYLCHMEQAGLDLNQYQAPHAFTYVLPTIETHLGIIILLRQQGRRPISARTLETMEQLRPFFLVVLSSMVARYFYTSPGSKRFSLIIADIYVTLDLTLREREILTFRLLGMQIKTIAGKLGVSDNAVKKHLARILRKGKARTVVALFLRYLLPCRDAPDDRWLLALQRTPETAERRAGTPPDSRPAIIRTAQGHLLW